MGETREWSRRRSGASLPGRSAPLLALAFLVGSSSCGEAQTGRRNRPREPIIGLPCEGCEAVFEGLPDSLAAASRIAPVGAEGEPMRIEGTVYDTHGEPAPGVIVYAYHTDVHGVYPPDARFRGRAAYRHGRFRGWAETDENGHYRFDTVRPAGYPNRRTPAHVHMHVIEVGRCTYYIDSIHFLDDPLLGPEERSAPDGSARGGSGLVRPRRDSGGVWVVTRDIVLGRGVPDYPAPEAPDPSTRCGPRRRPLSPRCDPSDHGVRHCDEHVFGLWVMMRSERPRGRHGHPFGA